MITPNTLIVGIDVAKKTHWARMINYQGVQHSKFFSIKNNIDGFESLEAKILDVKQKGALYILRHCPFPSDILAADKDALVTGIKEATNFRAGSKRIDRLITAAQRSIGVKNGLESAKLKLNSILDEIEFLAAQIEKTEQAMTEHLDKTGIKEYLLSIPGIGIVAAASFLGEVGDLKRFTHWKQIRKLAGLNLASNSSGQREGKTVISKRGRKVLRRILYQAAMVMVVKNPEFKALYGYLRHRKDNPLTPKQALMVISIKLIRLLYTLGTKKRNTIQLKCWET